MAQLPPFPRGLSQNLVYDDISQPMLWLLNFLNVMLRQSISVAVLGGLNKDLGLKGTDFSTAVSIHYVGYILGQVPANMLLTRTPPSWTMPISVFLGSVVTLALVAVDDFKGLVLQRFFFGIIAAPCWPGTLYLATAFYKKKEVGTRVGILYSSNILSTAFQGLIAAPIFSELSGVRGLNGWKWFYVILGAITGFVSSTSPVARSLVYPLILIIQNCSNLLLLLPKRTSVNVVAHAEREGARPQPDGCRHCRENRRRQPISGP